MFYLETEKRAYKSNLLWDWQPPRPTFDHPNGDVPRVGMERRKVGSSVSEWSTTAMSWSWMLSRIDEISSSVLGQLCTPCAAHGGTDTTQRVDTGGRRSRSGSELTADTCVSGGDGLRIPYEVLYLPSERNR